MIVFQGKNKAKASDLPVGVNTAGNELEHREQVSVLSDIWYMEIKSLNNSAVTTISLTKEQIVLSQLDNEKTFNNFGAKEQEVLI